jgi:4-diphosphocytidyl-2-C-methyl-D-erythritol kinase
VKRYSPAKVNLILEVLRKRKDGYHDLATLMQPVSLYDEMDLSLKGSEIVVKCPGSSLPENEENIAYRAAEALLKRAGCRQGVEIVIRKKIPIAAGLGGGSSNAAATLIALNELLRLSFTTEELMKIGTQLGADVPFFIFGKTAWAFGIGDQLREATGIPKLWFVILNPGIEIATKTVYEALKLGLTKERINTSIQKFQTAADIAGKLRNDLEDPAFLLHPMLVNLKKMHLEHGALGSLMSGSGSTVFGIYETEQKAWEAAESMKRKGALFVFTAHSL